MLELLIALFLVGVCALPLAQLPMKALQEETRSAYRMQLHRLADIAFAEFKEKIYQQEIPWKEICSPREAKSIFIPKEPAKVDFEPLRPRTFERKATFYSVGKKAKNGEEIRKVTFQVAFKTKEKKFLLFRGKKNRYAPSVFTYQIIVVKPSPAEQTPLEIAPANPPKGQAVG
jgi:hypothetical protein